ncbi:MAG: hypothetical protein ACOCVZ_04535 [Gemmatimonadota bacterium]
MSRAQSVLLLLLLAAGGGALGAQEPDTIPDPTRAPTDSAPPLAQDTTPAPRPAYVPPRAAFSLTVGTLGLGTLQRQPVLFMRRDPAGDVPASATLNRSVEADGGAHLAAAVTASLSRAWAVRLGAGVGRATLRTGYSGQDSLFVRTARAVSDRESVALSILSLEAALRFRIPSTRRAQPFVELGIASLGWAVDGALPGGEGLSDARRTAALAAVGAIVPVTGPLAARIQASTRVFRTPLDPAAEGAAGLTSSTLTASFLDPPGDGFADTARELIQTARLELGLTFQWGTVPEPPPDRSGTDASPSSPGR